jgi:ABC-type microcin C transport system duplicated ATPase subunit YejF
MMTPLLSVQNLHVAFRQGAESISAVSGIDFDIRRGETFALVGESGSGKSVTALSVLRLLPLGGRILQGTAKLDGVDLFDLPEYQVCAIRGGRIGIVFQDPMSSLNPVMTVGAQIGEVLRLHKGLKGKALQERAMELLGQVGMPRPERHFHEYPHQFSGGMRQRAMIAIALAGEPDLLIADEPTTALDVTIQAQILALLKRLQQETGMALWLITHDLGIVAHMADRVAVMRQGEIVEAAEGGAFFAGPRHPYSLQLFAARPRLESCLERAAVNPSSPRRGEFIRPEDQDGDDEEAGCPHNPKFGEFISSGERNGANEFAPTPLLEVRDCKVYYPIRKGLFQRVVDHVRAVDGVSFDLAQGQTLALVGESGCGKTTLGKAMLGLIEATDGRVLFEGEDVTGKRGKARRAEMQIVFQDPFSSMNPRMIVGDIVEEGLRALRPEMTAQARRARCEELLEAVGLPRAARFRYPHEFSGGQRQRICIARALAVEPRLIVCDEPTSALDVSVQKQIIDLLKTLRREQGLSYLFISHDLAVVAELADRAAVMHRGRIVEIGPVEQVLFEPKHEYTRKLLQAIPKIKAPISIPSRSRPINR